MMSATNEKLWALRATLVIFTSLFNPLIINAGYDGVWYGIITILMIPMIVPDIATFLPRFMVK